MQTCSVRYVHKIAPKDTDIGPDVNLPGSCFSDRNTLGAALRRAGVMISGARVRTFRVEGDRVLIFPTCPGLSTYWHCIVLTLHSECTHLVPDFDMMSIDALMGFWHRYSRASRAECAARLGHSRPGHCGIASDLACYASNLATARRCEEQNDAAGAACYRSHVRLCLERLPADLQAWIANKPSKAAAE